MGKNSARLGIYSLAGFYLLFLVYQMYSGLADSESRVMMIIAMIIFSIAGAGLVVFGVAGGYRVTKERAEAEAKRVSEEKRLNTEKYNPNYSEIEDDYMTAEGVEEFERGSLTDNGDVKGGK